MTYNKNAYLELRELVKKNIEGKEEVIVICIGTDRSTGDSLGPFTGTFLESSKLKMLKVYGTIEYPMHAVNIQERMKEIREKHKNALVIAIDAAMGDAESIGVVKVIEGSVKPGAAFGRRVEEIGHISIKVTMAELTSMSMLLLNNVRLNEVIQKAEEIKEVVKMIDNYLNRKTYRKKFAEVAATREKESEKIFPNLSKILKKHPN